MYFGHFLDYPYPKPIIPSLFLSSSCIQVTGHNRDFVLWLVPTCLAHSSLRMLGLCAELRARVLPECKSELGELSEVDIALSHWPMLQISINEKDNDWGNCLGLRTSNGDPIVASDWWRENTISHPRMLVCHLCHWLFNTDNFPKFYGCKNEQVK